MNISDIREIFSKGSVALTKTGIRILYTNKDGWITQSIESNKETLSDLIKNCKSVVIECVRGFTIKVSFLENVTDRKTILYQPIDNDDCEEFDTSIIEGDSEFFDFFIGADLNDTADFIGRVNDFLEYYDCKRELTEYDFRKYQKDWASFKKVVTEFSNLTGSRYEEEDREWITVYFPEGKKISISDRSKFLFSRAVDMSEVVDIECSIDNAMLNITFYV